MTGAALFAAGVLGLALREIRILRGEIREQSTNFYKRRILQ